MLGTSGWQLVSAYFAARPAADCAKRWELLEAQAASAEAGGGDEAEAPSEGAGGAGGRRQGAWSLEEDARLMLLHRVFGGGYGEACRLVAHRSQRSVTERLIVILKGVGEKIAELGPESIGADGAADAAPAAARRIGAPVAAAAAAGYASNEDDADGEGEGEQGEAAAAPPAAKRGRGRPRGRPPGSSRGQITARGRGRGRGGAKAARYASSDDDDDEEDEAAGDDGMGDRDGGDEAGASDAAAAQPHVRPSLTGAGRPFASTSGSAEGGDGLNLAQVVTGTSRFGRQRRVAAKLEE